MKNELNLLLMSADEVTRWYKPQSPEEQYLVDLISSLDFTKQKELEKELEDEIEELKMDDDILQDFLMEYSLIESYLEFKHTKLKDK